MAKRILQQRRGRGTMTYRVRGRAFRHRIQYPNEEGKGKVIKLISSQGHSAPIAKIMFDSKIFYNLASKNMFEGQEVSVGGNEIADGNVLPMEKMGVGVEIYNIESRPGDGGKMIRTGGSSAIITKKQEGKVAVLLPSKKEKWFNSDCRATIGVAAGHGRLEKPILQAGKKYYIMKSRSKVWPRTSAVAMNVIDHPFGSGRGKNISHGNKGKIPKRNSPPRAKVGSLRPRRTGRKKK